MMIQATQTIKYKFFDILEPTAEMSEKLAPEETIRAVFKTFRDYAVFTDCRVMLADKQGMIGQKVEVLTIPYKSILMYSMENAGVFDLDAEMELWIAGGVRVKLEFIKGKKTRQMLQTVEQVIGAYLLK